MWFKNLSGRMGQNLRNLNKYKKYIDGKEYYKYRCTCHR